MAQPRVNGQACKTCDGDNLDTFLFTSESVGEGHPGLNAYLFTFSCFYKNINFITTFKIIKLLLNSTYIYNSNAIIIYNLYYTIHF